MHCETEEGLLQAVKTWDGVLKCPFDCNGAAKERNSGQRPFPHQLAVAVIPEASTPRTARPDIIYKLSCPLQPMLHLVYTHLISLLLHMRRQIPACVVLMDEGPINSWYRLQDIL